MFTFLRHSVNFYFGFAVLIFYFASCSNEIPLNVPGDPVPVVWCLLNPNANEQHVRLGRSFMNDPNDPLKPPITDSTVWNLAVTVYVEEWQNGLPSKIFHFDPITSPPKDSGYFPNDNLRLYRAMFKPDRLSTYRIYVHFEDDDRIVTGTTLIPAQPLILDPLEIPGRKINLQSGVQYTMRWNPAVGAGIYQGCFRVFYDETINSQTTNFDAVVKQAPLLIFADVVQIQNQASGVHFINELSKLIPFKAGAERSITGLQFQLYTGGEELALQVSPDLQMTTISGSLNQYTNLSHGIGLFSSLQLQTISNLELSNTTLNDIARSDQTKNLGFRDVHGGEQ